MDLYGSIKPALVTVLLIVVVVRAVMHLIKKETKEMWISVLIGAIILVIVNGPEQTLNSFQGLVNLVLDYISTLGG